MEHNEESLKVLARLTPVGAPFPRGAWFYNKNVAVWGRSDGRDARKGGRISELEANQLGIYRDPGQGPFHYHRGIKV